MPEFGYPFKEKTLAWLGMRAIHCRNGGGIDIVHDRVSRTGDGELMAQLCEWADEGPMDKLCDWADETPGSSHELFELREGNKVLRGSPMASYGHFYVGLGMLAPDDCTTHEHENAGVAIADPAAVCRATIVD